MELVQYMEGGDKEERNGSKEKRNLKKSKNVSLKMKLEEK